jgi:radical SAM protein with 4Fe4S-binding SPASM domain
MRNLERIAKSEYKDQVILLFSVNALTYNDIDTFKAMAERLGLRYMLNRPATVGRATENWSVLRLSAEDLAAFSKSQRPKTPFYCYHLCQLHWTSIMVNGDVTPCGFLRSDEYVLGNLKEQSLGDIWHCEKYDSFRGMCAHDVSECRECEFKFVCTAGCCGETVSFSGNILNPYSGCQLKPYENKDYLKINDDELFLVSKNAAGIFDFIKRGDFIAS